MDVQEDIANQPLLSYEEVQERLMQLHSRLGWCGEHCGDPDMGAALLGQIAAMEEMVMQISLSIEDLQITEDAEASSNDNEEE